MSTNLDNIIMLFSSRSSKNYTVNSVKIIMHLHIKCTILRIPNIHQG